MRNFIVWTLSFLLVFEPAVWAANRPTINELKEIVEFSEVTKRAMTLKELYGRSIPYLPKHVRDQIDPVIAEYGDYKLPKFNVTKLKNSAGEDYFQLSAVQDGKSVTLSLGESAKAPVKMNGKVIEAADMNNVLSILTKANVSKSELKQVPVTKRVPAQVYILNSKQIERLNLEQKRSYYKQLRGLLESMEAVSNIEMSKSKKSSSREPASINSFAALLIGEQALAGGSVGGPCVAAGYVAEINYNKQRGGLSCGADLQGNVDAKYRGSCSPSQFFCNPTVYGPNGGCVDAGRETTAVCNRVTGSGKDIPDLNQDNKQRFEVLRDKAMNYSGEVINTCAESINGPLAADQGETCQNFNSRKDEITSWDCANPNFKSKYPKLCSGADQPGPGPGYPPPGGGGTDGPGTPPGGPGYPPPPGGGPGNGGPGTPGYPPGPGAGGPVDDREVKCEALGPDFSMDMKATCSRGGMINTACTRVDGNAVPVSKCICDNGGKIIGQLKCDGGGSGDGKDYESWKKDRGNKKKKKGPNWLLIFGAGALGLLTFHLLTKKAVKQQYKNIDPLPSATPVPVDVTAPGAR